MTSPTTNDLTHDLARERRAHAITRGLLANVTQELADATLLAEQLVSALQEAQAPDDAQEGAA